MGRCALPLTSWTPVAALVGVAIFGAGLCDGGESTSPKLSQSGQAVAAAEGGIMLTSSASAEVTRRVSDRIRLQLKRYGTFLPRRESASPGELAPLRVQLCGTFAEYQAELEKRGLRIENPACYLADEKLVLLGFNGGRYSVQLSASRDRSVQLEREIGDARKQFAVARKAQEAKFVKDNVAEPLRNEVLKGMSQDFQKTLNQAVQRRADAEKKNEQLLKAATSQLLMLADHELFHAYVDDRVYPRRSGGLPAWLDEGLAQLVEHGTWRSNDTLAFETPSPTLKQRLQKELKAANAGDAEPPTVASILTLDGKQYLSAAPRATDDVRRRYLYAWALAQMLAETKRLTPRDALDRYVDDRHADPEVRFASFTKKSASEFENEWRAYLQKIAR